MANNHYDVPKWAGKPPSGLHLDVSKDNKLIQKVMVDEKKCYLFGRNPNLNDVCIDHASCSRVHAALVHHKHLQRSFLVDLGSTHGTFIGSIHIDANKPTQLPIDSTFHFGASTRYYTLREKPLMKSNTKTEDTVSETTEQLLLPENELELDNLTEYNTAHNKRISMLGIGDDILTEKSKKRKRSDSIRFCDEDEVINPEDVDPSVGKFRNLVQTSVIPKKRFRAEFPMGISRNEDKLKISTGSSSSSYLQSSLLSSTTSHSLLSNPLLSSSLSLRLGIHLPNPAPDVDIDKISNELSLDSEDTATGSLAAVSDDEYPKKKKYAKEAWPGRKAGSLLM